MSEQKTVVVLNQSRRLHMIGGVRIMPTAAKPVPESATKTKAFAFLTERGEVAIVNEERDPILDEEEARKEAARRKKEGERTNNGVPVKSTAQARKTGTGRAGGKKADAPAPVVESEKVDGDNDNEKED